MPVNIVLLDVVVVDDDVPVRVEKEGGGGAWKALVVVVVLVRRIRTTMSDDCKSASVDVGGARNMMACVSDSNQTNGKK